MALDSFSGLKTEIENWLDHDAIETSAEELIRLGEVRMAREIRCRDMEARAQATVDDRFLALPARFVLMRSLRILNELTSGPRIKWKPKEITLDELEKKSVLEAGVPRWFAVHEEIEFDRAPVTTESAEMIYLASFAPLSDSNTTNALLAKAPDAYLYSALVAATPFLGEDERLPVWEREYIKSRDGINHEYRMSQYGPGIASRVDGTTP